MSLPDRLSIIPENTSGLEKSLILSAMDNEMILPLCSADRNGSVPVTRNDLCCTGVLGSVVIVDVIVGDTIEEHPLTIPHMIKQVRRWSFFIIMKKR